MPCSSSHNNAVSRTATGCHRAPSLQRFHRVWCNTPVPKTAIFSSQPFRPSCRYALRDHSRRVGRSTMPSADFCNAVKNDCSSFRCSLNTLQTSRGKTLDFPGVGAGFIKRTPVADGELRCHVPARPEYVTPHIQFLFVAPQACVGLPSDPISQ